MPARSGPAPWNLYAPVADTTKSGKDKLRLTSGNYEWTLTDGWHFKRDRGWISKGKKTYIDEQVYDDNGNITGTVKKPMVEKTRVTGPDGKSYQVYKTKGYDDYIGFHAHGDLDWDTATIDGRTGLFTFIHNAFNINNPSHGPIFESNGCGHISKIEYAQMQQLLRVTFANGGDVCIFFKVPRAIAGELLSLAQSKQGKQDSRGVIRHDLGKRFWDLVRIRGQRYGARYPFEYLKHGYTMDLTGSNKRYTVKLSDENYKIIKGKAWASGVPLKPGDLITSVLSEEEYAKLQQILEEEESHESSIITGIKESDLLAFDDSGGNKGSKKAKRGRPSKNSNTSEADQGSGLHFENIGVINKDVEDLSFGDRKVNARPLEDILGTNDMKRYASLSKKLIDAQAASDAAHQQDLDNKLHDLMTSNPVYNKMDKNVLGLQIQFMVANKLKNVSKDREDYESLVDKTLQQTINRIILGGDYFKTKAEGGWPNNPGFDMRNKYMLNWRKTVSRNKPVKPENVLNSTELADYTRMSKLIKKASPEYAKMVSPYVGRSWTIEQLKDFANPTVAGNILEKDSYTYKKLINAGDYENALNFLKSHKHEVFYKTDKRHGNRMVSAGRYPYASPYDFIVGTEEE